MIEHQIKIKEMIKSHELEKVTLTNGFTEKFNLENANHTSVIKKKDISNERKAKEFEDFIL